MEEAWDTVFRSRPVSVIRNWKLLLFHEEWVLDGGREKIETNNSVELYNLKSDISERNNLCNTELVVRNELLENLLNWINETGAPIPVDRNEEYKNSND